MNITINVTNDDIWDGERDDCENCPIAKAIGRVINPDFYFRVQHAYIVISRRPSKVCLAQILMPKIATNFIIDFDSRKGTSPFSFEIEISEEFLRSAA